MTERKTLTIADAVALGAIVHMAIAGEHVARAMNDDVVQGTARSLVISPDRPYSLGWADDVRDAYLHVTLDTGFEAFWPVAELIQDAKEFTFVEYAR